MLLNFIARIIAQFLTNYYYYYYYYYYYGKFCSVRRHGTQSPSGVGYAGFLCQHARNSFAGAGSTQIIN